MANIIQRPTYNPPDKIQNYNYPILKLNPNAEENIFIGRKVKILIYDNIKYKNYATAACAISAIFIVGAIFALCLSQLNLASALAYVGIFSGIGGALYFVRNHFFNPLSKLERERRLMRFLPLERILARKLDNIEEFDLLKKVIEDRTFDLDEKFKTYIFLRQIKRILEKWAVLRNGYRKEVKAKYLKTKNDLENWRNQGLKAVYGNSGVTSTTETGAGRIEEIYEKYLKEWENWQKDSMEIIQKGYKNAFDNLELEYQKFINNLGKPPTKSFLSRLLRR